MQESHHTVIALPTRIGIAQPLPHITWIPVTPAPIAVETKEWTPSYRQAVTVAWLLDNFRSERSMPLFDAQKYSYFLQRSNLADLNISFLEFVAGPYAPALTYHAGMLAKRQSFWKVIGKTNVARGRNIKKAIAAAKNILVDVDQARRLIERLAELTKDDLGGLATVDFASREIYARGKAITPESIHAYFLSDWTEKVDNPWFTAENIDRAMNLLNELGLFRKSMT